eukprot:8438653-Pyramimonas_sp.AAC.1
MSCHVPYEERCYRVTWHAQTRAVQCCSIDLCALGCHSTPRCVMICNAMLGNVRSWRAVLGSVKLDTAMECNAMAC